MEKERQLRQERYAKKVRLVALLGRNAKARPMEIAYWITINTRPLNLFHEHSEEDFGCRGLDPESVTGVREEKGLVIEILREAYELREHVKTLSPEEAHMQCLEVAWQRYHSSFFASIVSALEPALHDRVACAGAEFPFEAGKP